MSAVNAPDLLSVVLHIQPLEIPEGRPLPLWWARAAHALFLRAIAASDPALARRLHEPTDVPRPFTVSTLMGPHSHTGLVPDAVYRLRFTAYQREVAAALQQACLPGGSLAVGVSVDLDKIPFRIVSAPNGAPSPWEAATTFTALAAPWLTAQEMPARTWTLQLASPTAFRSGGMHIPFPLPALVFGSLLQRWNAYAPLALPEETRRFAAESVAVTRYHLHTRRVPLKSGGIRIGAVGQVRYRALTYDRYWMSVIQTLSAFALFAGVGIGTSAGMGQVRWLAPDRKPKPVILQESVREMQ